jgi:hypothetical protein
MPWRPFRKNEGGHAVKSRRLRLDGPPSKLRTARSQVTYSELFVSVTTMLALDSGERPISERARTIASGPPVGYLVINAFWHSCIPLIHHVESVDLQKKRTPPPNGSGIHGHFCLSFSLGGCFLGGGGGVFGLASGAAGRGACL